MGNSAATQLQRGEGREDALTGDTAELHLCRGQSVEVGTSRPKGGQHLGGEEPGHAASAELVLQLQRPQAVVKMPPHQALQDLDGELGARKKWGQWPRRAPSVPWPQWGDLPVPSSVPCLQWGDLCSPVLGPLPAVG